MQKKFTFVSSPFPLSKILVALLVAFTAAERFFMQLYGLQTKRANKRCRAYTTLFSNMNTKLLKLRIICSCKLSVFYAKVQSTLVPPHFRLVPSHFACSSDGTVDVHLNSGEKSVPFLVKTFFFFFFGLHLNLGKKVFHFC